MGVCVALVFTPRLLSRSGHPAARSSVLRVGRRAYRRRGVGVAIRWRRFEREQRPDHEPADGALSYETWGTVMAATVREAIRELLQQTVTTIDTLLGASDRELAKPSSHGCAQGKDVWTLLTNDIDHEKIHTGQILEGRYESRITASPMERLVAEWLVERARLIGSMVGLTDEQFNSETAPGEWTYRVIAKHVLALEQDSLKTIAADQAARATTQPAR